MTIEYSIQIALENMRYQTRLSGLELKHTAAETTLFALNNVVGIPSEEYNKYDAAIESTYKEMLMVVEDDRVYKVGDKCSDPAPQKQTITQIVSFEGHGNNETEVNEWLKNHTEVDVANVTYNVMYDLYSGQAPQVCNQWVITTIIYRQ